MTVSVQTIGGGAPARTLSLPWIIAASSVGTLIEWYDFYLYGVLALFFSKHFFSPELNPTVAFIASLFVFWTGFLVRRFDRPQIHLYADLGIDGRGDLPRRPIAGLCGDRSPRPDPAGHNACPAGSRLGRRLRRCGDLHRRARIWRQTRPLYKLDPDHGDDGDRPCTPSHPDLPVVVRRPSIR